ncbi:leucine-rich repeat protein [Lacrimispora saccharolytica]|nr:leucine-rich repeat protein [Lacrimispora saccharolytica]
MRRKKMANKIVSILMAGLMLVSTPMSVLATDGEIQQMTDQIEVQTSMDNEEITENDDSLTEEMTGEDADEEITADDPEAFEGEAEEEIILGDSEEDIAPFVTEEDTQIEGTTAPNAQIYVTISVKGQFAKSKDGSTMAQKAVTVQDLNKDGMLSVDEALMAAHKAYYDGDVTNGYGTEESQYGTMLTKLWGDESGSFGYWKNDTSCMSLDDEVKENDNLVAFVYKSGYLDAYTKFNLKEYSVEAEDPFTVQLEKAGYDESGNTIFSDYDGAVLTAYDSEFGELPEDTYSIDGYQVTFKNAGEYYLVASGTEEVVLVPSVVKVTVTKNEENQKQYLSSLEIFPLTLGKFQLFEPGKYEYVYELPSSFSKRFQFYGTLSEAAPENSNVTLTYYDTKGKLTTKKFLKKSGGTYYLFVTSVVSAGLSAARCTVSVGVDGDMQNYIITMPRIPEIASALLTDASGETLTEAEGIYYVSENQSNQLHITLDAYGASLKVNGQATNEKEACEIAPVFDETSKEYKITVTANNNDKEHEIEKTYTYTVKKFGQDDTVKGTCGKAASWELHNGVLKISGSGVTDNWTTKQKTPWNGFADSIQEVVIDSGITGIGDYGFYNYPELQKVTLSKTVTAIGSGTFQGCSKLQNVIFDEGLKSIATGAFADCVLLKEIVLPESVSDLGKEAFRGCTNLEKAEVGVLSDSCFSKCSNLKEVILRNTVRNIPQYSFSDCTSLDRIVLPEGVETIVNKAFYNCTSLKEMMIPDSLTTFNGMAFENCPVLENIIPEGERYVLDGNLIYSSNKKTLVLCAPGYKGTVSVAEGVDDISDAAFYNCEKVTEIILPSTVATIGYSCFFGCTSLKNIILPNSVTSASGALFKNCTALETVEISSGLKTISNSMFESCTNLKKIQIPEGVTEIGAFAFRSCTNLKDIILPTSLESFSGNQQFFGCSSLTTIIIPDKVTSLSDQMFGGCKNLQSVVIPEGLSSIGTGNSGNPWNGAPLEVSINFKGSPKQWYSIPNITSIRRTNLTFYYGAPADDTMVDTQPQAMICREGTAKEDVTPLSVHMAELKDGESYEYAWFCNSTQETLRDASILSNETVSEDGRTSQYIPDAAKAGTYNYYCIIGKKDAEGNVLAYTITQLAKVAITVSNFQGYGTEKEPYQIASKADLTELYNLVAAGNSMNGIYFKMTEDITLDADWKPIGTAVKTSFGGNFDGDGHKLTIDKGGLPLLGYINGAEVKNLKIYGEQIAGAGLVNCYTGVGLEGNAITIDNVRLLSGTQTLKSGLVASIGGNDFAHASAGFVVTIRNCVIEDGVTVGYTENENRIGSFAGAINGSIENCESSAIVKGIDAVGGILGTRDNAMSQCVVKNSKFHGTVEGKTFVGGIVGSGYNVNNSAPNGAKITIQNCIVDGTVKGDTCIGGIWGGDPYVAQTWDNVISPVTANKFIGSISGNKYVGAIIGYLNSLNRYDNIVGNTFRATDSTKVGIGFVKYLDTSYENPTVMEGTIVINTANGTSGCPTVEGCGWKANHNRTDDPLGKDADALAKAADASNPICYELKAEGTCKTEYQMGEDLDLTGLEITGYWDNGTTTKVDLKDIEISGYDKNQTGQQSVVLSYGAAKLYIVVTVIPRSSVVTVTVSILGDEKHGDTKTPHGLKNGGLITWASEEVQADTANTVWDVLKKFMDDHKIIYTADDNNQYNTVYIKKVNGLEEFDNGPKSGWMYTVNGIHPNVGVSAKYVQDKDVIILHYTDDYSTEESVEYDQAMVKEVTDAINAIPSEDQLNLENKAQVSAARDAYNALTEEQKAQVSAEALARLAAAEKRIAELEASQEPENPTPPAHVHAYGEWKKISDATVFAPEKQERACSCGAKEIRDYGSALKAIIKVNATTVPLKVKQKTSAFKVTGLAKGDSVQSYKSSNTKIFTVTKSGVLKAGKKTGKATLTITLASGLQKKVTVKVQKKTVTTSKITGLQKKVTLKKGKKLTLKPSLTPITSTQKFTYKSSNKKIATVSSKGVITGKKAGKTKITVKSGSKKYTVTVTVTK